MNVVDVDIIDIKHLIVLHSLYLDSNCSMQKLYINVIAVVYHFGNPLLLLKFTTNHQWLKILRKLLLC